MTRTAILKSAIPLVVLIACAGQLCGGDPPVPVEPGARVNLGVLPSSSSPFHSPHVEDHAISGCLDDPNDPWWPPCGDDEIELTVGAGTLHVLHRNATYNCCPDDIVISMSLEGDLIQLTEEEILPNPCYCICCYNVEATIVDLAPGPYTVEFCWFDYDTWQIECYVEDIVIPPGDKTAPGDPPRGNPPVPVDPAGVRAGDPQASEIGFYWGPRIDGFSNSGCLEGPSGDPWPCEDPDEVELTVEGHALHVLHTNVNYNCCLDDIVVSLIAEGDLLHLTEEEILANGGCCCVCCYSVEATVVDLPSGEYTVEFCWYDYDTSQIECYVEQIVIP